MLNPRIFFISMAFLLTHTQIAFAMYKTESNNIIKVKADILPWLPKLLIANPEINSVEELRQLLRRVTELLNHNPEMKLAELNQNLAEPQKPATASPKKGRNIHKRTYSGGYREIPEAEASSHKSGRSRSHSQGSLTELSTKPTYNYKLCFESNEFRLSNIIQVKAPTGNSFVRSMLNSEADPEQEKLGFFPLRDICLDRNDLDPYRFLAFVSANKESIISEYTEYINTSTRFEFEAKEERKVIQEALSNAIKPKAFRLYQLFGYTYMVKIPKESKAQSEYRINCNTLDLQMAISLLNHDNIILFMNKLAKIEDFVYRTLGQNIGNNLYVEKIFVQVNNIMTARNKVLVIKEKEVPKKGKRGIFKVKKK